MSEACDSPHAFSPERADTMTVQDLVNAYVEALSDDGESTIPMATTDPDEVIRSQLTENTGRHLLDSGGAYGRNWEENRENPPWEKPEWKVYDGGFASHNLYNHMERTLSRDRLAVSLEIALYAFGRSDDERRNSWLSSMEGFADLLSEPVYAPELADAFDLPDEVADDVAGYAAGAEGTDRRPFTFYTYNSEFGSLSQNIQATALDGGPYAEYWAIQVHGGCDARGGFTAPRVYHAEWDTPMTTEFSYYCENCGWTEAESCIAYDHEDLYFFEGVVDGFDFVEAGLVDEDDESEIPVLETVWDADHIDGAIIHDCQGTDRFGHVHP